MAREIPSAPRVHTTVYDNFKGVDYTNDSTNVWRRRSPTGVNMLPDASGRPFKRNGWSVMISNEELSDRFSVASCTVTKCAYFELAGVDHVVVFTDSGVMFYHGNANTDIVNTEWDCFSGKDRCFFFEGNGTSAFYIYGNYRVWKYWYDGEFHLTEVTDELTIPTVLISTSADGTGTSYQGYNMLGSMINVLYHDAELFTYWGSDGLILSVDKDTFIAGKTKGNPSVYTYTCTTASTDLVPSGVWSPTLDAGITVSNAKVNDVIVVIYGVGVVLPNNIAYAQADKLSVLSSTTIQFDTEIDVQTSGTPSVGECVLHPDPIDRQNKRAWLEFNPSQTFASLDEQDIIKVTMPSNEVSSSQKTISPFTGSATFIGEEI